MIKNIKIGDIIGLYFKVIKIYHGAFGTVYVCKDTRFDIKYALKTFKDNLIKKEDFKKHVQLFNLEAWNWINLNAHPNIVAAYDYLFEDYRPFLILEAICPQNGKQSLTEYLHDDLDELTIIDWGIQFAYGMEYANSHGVIAHRDLKPDNILIKNNILKISDFGLSDFVDKTFKLNSDIENTSNMFIGTEEYSAPECFRGHSSVKSDIYSFGIIFYQLINHGILPFNAKYFEDYNYLHENVKPKKLKSDLWPIISKCLEKDPNARYDDFTELKKDLINIYSKKTDKEHYKPIITKNNMYEDLAEKNLNFKFDEKAEEDYQKAIKENPNNPILHFNLAISLLNKGDIEESKNIFEGLKNKNFLTPELFYNLGIIYGLEENHEKAIEHYLTAIDLSIDSFDYLYAYINLANEFTTIGNYLKSIIYLKKAYSLKPKCLIIVNNLTNTYLKNHNIEEAKKLFNEFKENIETGDYIGNKKEVSGFYYNWGKLCMRCNDNQKAIAMFNESIKYDENNIETLLDLTFLEIKFGIPREEKLVSLIDKHSDDRFKFLLANLYFINEKFDKGIEIYDYLVENDFYLVDEFFIFKYLMPEKDYSKLVISFNEFIDEKLEEDKNNITLLTFKGMLFIEIDNYEEADQNLDNVLNIEPKDYIEGKYKEIYLHSMGGC